MLIANFLLLLGLITFRPALGELLELSSLWGHEKASAEFDSLKQLEVTSTQLTEPAFNLLDQQRLELLFDYLSQALFGALLLICFSNLIIYSQRRKDQSSLFIALGSGIALVISEFGFKTHFYLESLGLSLVHFGQFGVLVCSYYFLSVNFTKQRPRWLWLLAPMSFIATFILDSSFELSWQQACLSALIPLALFLFFYVKLWKISSDKLLSSSLIFIQLSSFVFLYFAEPINNANLSIFLAVLVAAFFLQTWSVAKDFARAFQRAEDLAKEILEKEKQRTLFFHNTSHELRTPLNGIIGYLRLVSSGHFGELSDSSILVVKKVLRLCESLKIQINAILDLAKEASKDNVHRARSWSLASLETFLSQLFESLALKEKSLKPKFHVKDPQAQVIIDKVKVTSFLHAFSSVLLSKAEWFDSEKCSINLAAENDNLLISVDLDVSKKQELMPLSILNETFDLKLLEKMKECSASYETKMLDDNTLEIVLKIEFQKLADEIKFTNEIDSVRKEFVDTKAHREIQLPELKVDFSWDILIADPHDSSRQLLAQRLSNDGYKVRQAKDLSSALDQIAVNKPNLLITEFMFENASLVESIKASQETANLNFIIVSSRSSDEDRLYGLSLGALDYIAKPVVIDEVRLRIHKIVERELLILNKEFSDKKVRHELQTRNVLVSTLCHRTNNPLNYVATGIRTIDQDTLDLKDAILALVSSDEGENDSDQLSQLRNQYLKEFALISSDVEMLHTGLSLAARSVKEIRQVSGVDGLVLSKISLSELVSSFEERLQVVRLEKNELIFESKIVEEQAGDFIGNLASLVIFLDMIADSLEAVQKKIVINFLKRKSQDLMQFHILIEGASFRRLMGSDKLKQLAHLLSGFGMHLEFPNDRMILVTSSKYLDDSLSSLEYRYAS